MINRGVSGELASQAAARIKNEVALTEPDLVLWQVGTNDALAYVPLDEFEATVVDTLTWLKEHKIDIVLVGLQYVDRMEQDEHYREVREMLRKIAAKENVMIVRRYEAQQLLAQAASSGGGLVPTSSSAPRPAISASRSTWRGRSRSASSAPAGWGRAVHRRDRTAAAATAAAAHVRQPRSAALERDSHDN